MNFYAHFHRVEIMCIYCLVLELNMLRAFPYMSSLKLFLISKIFYCSYILIWLTALLLFSSVAQLCPTLCDSMDCSTPGFLVHHQRSELAQTHVHQVGDAIQSSHSLSSPSLAFNPSQHQSLFQGVSSSHQMAKVIGVSASASVLPMDSQDWFPLGWTGWISLQSKGLSRAFSNTTVQKHQFFDFHILSININ